MEITFFYVVSYINGNWKRLNILLSKTTNVKKLNNKSQNYGLNGKINKKEKKSLIFKTWKFQTFYKFR